MEAASAPSTIVRWAWSFARPHRRAFAALIALSIAEICLRLVAPFAMLAVVDHALGKAPVTGLLARALAVLHVPTSRGALLALFAGGGLAIQLVHEIVVMRYGRRSIRVGHSMVRDLREQLFEHVQAWSIAHHGRTPVGEAIQYLGADTRCVDQLVLRGAYPIAFSVLTLVAMFGVLAALDLQLAVLAAAIVPPLWAWLSAYSRKMRPHADHARLTDSRLSAHLVEAMTSIRLIKSHAREPVEQARFSDVARANANAWIGVGTQGTTFSFVSGAFTLVGTSGVLFAGGLAVIGGSLTLGTLLLALTYLGYIYGPLSSIARTTSDLQEAFASARRIHAAFAIEPEHARTAAPPHTAPIRGEVRFDEVSLAFGDQPALDHVSFTARPGETIALVGPSGAGKSTLAAALVRFHEPCGGRISIDGVPLERFDLHHLRRNVALVLQDPMVVSGTVRANLCYSGDAPDDIVEDAARAAHAHGFISRLRDGYATELGENGAPLSDGQRQRLSLARAFVKAAPILVLDEPTAALDTISERLVVAALDRLSENRTTLVVAHRLTTVERADRILVMDHGRIIAQGSHGELLAACPLYRELAAQLGTRSDRRPG